MVLLDRIEVDFSFLGNTLFDFEQLTILKSVLLDLLRCLADRDCYLRIAAHTLLVVTDILLINFKIMMLPLQNVDLIVETIHLLLLFKSQVIAAINLLELFA